MSKFEDWWNIHNCVKESLMREDAEYVYESRQDEVYKLQSEIDKLQKRAKELELINFDSELHFDAAKEHIDHLQKRVDEISNHVEINYDENRDDDSHSYWSGYNQALRELFEILKGDSHES